MKIIRMVKVVGTGAHVTLPKEWLGKKVLVELIGRENSASSYHPSPQEARVAPIASTPAQSTKKEQEQKKEVDKQ